MQAARIVVLISGSGTNLQAIIDACATGILPMARVVHVISNQHQAGGLQRAQQANIGTCVVVWDKEAELRESYDSRLAALVIHHQPDLIVLAGWMHLLTPSFLRHFTSEQVINLHPALPDQYPGARAIERAHRDGKASGVMAHTVIPQVDAGRPLSTLPVPLIPGESLASFRARIQLVEKAVLICAISAQLARTPPVLLRCGKVRDVYQDTDSTNDTLLMVATDRLSSFDRHICDVPQKGNVLNQLSAWWFERTRHIVPNHMVRVCQGVPAMQVRACEVFAVEFVVRGFITGTTNTSMWTLYQRGERHFGGHIVSEGLRRNQRLEQPIVTPTTKSETHDETIDRRDIEQRNIMPLDQYDECCRVALDLFQHGQEVAAKRGLLLVDTKYEFGIDHVTGQLMLVDELHTCDSSRYWLSATYEERFQANQEPDRFDKDIIRTYVRAQCDPYAGEQIPAIPDHLVQRVSQVYLDFFTRLTGESIVACQSTLTPRVLALC